MSRSRFVRPDTVTLPISNGDSLTVKRYLNVGEVRAQYARMTQATASGTDVALKPLDIGVAKVSAYLLDWTLTDEQGAKVAIAGLPTDKLITVVDNLHPDDFKEIRDAVDKHEDAMTAARAEEKKLPGGEKIASETSASPSAAAGASSGSEISTPMTTTSSAA